MVLIIHPGDPSIKQTYAQLNNAPANISAVEKISDLVRNMFPENLVQAAFQQMETEYKEVQMFDIHTNSNITVIKMQRNYVYGMNVLGDLLIYSLV